MKKTIFIFIVLFLLSLLYAMLTEVNFNSFIDGLNTKWSPNKVLNTQCTDVDNILFDEKLGLAKRDGYSLKATINSAGNYINGITYTRLTGDKYYVLQKGSSLYKSPDLTSWTTFETGLNTTHDCRFTVYMNDLWRTNGNDNVASYDNTTLTKHNFIPKGKFIVVYNESIFIGNTTDEQSGVYFSSLVLGPKSSIAWKSRYVFYIGRNDGDAITGLYVWNGILWIFKKNSIWGLSGYSIDDYTLRQYTNEFGCLDDRTIQEKGNGLVFLSSKGFIKFDGASAEIISKIIELSINDLSVNSKIERNWSQSSQADFQLGTVNNADITNYPGEIRSSSATYKLWTSSSDFTDGLLPGSVNIDTVTFSRNGLICNDVRLTDDFSSEVISSSWTIIQSVSYPNANWDVSNYYLTLSTGGTAASSGWSTFNAKGTILFNNYKNYGRRKWDGLYGIHKIYAFSDANVQADGKTYLGLTFDYSNADEYCLSENNSSGAVSITPIQSFTRPSNVSFASLVSATTHTFCVGKDYDGRYSLSINNREWMRTNNYNSPVYSKDVNLSAFRIEETARYTSSGKYDNFAIYTSTYSIYISSWDTTIAGPIWEMFLSSVATYGISDIGFQTRVSADGSSWDDWIGISSGQTPSNASKRYIQVKATTTVNTLYEVLSPEIMEIFLSRSSTGSFISQDKYVGSDIVSWGNIDIDDTDNIGYFIAGATSSYNLSIASYIPVSNGQTIPLNPSANYVKWRSTYTSSVSQITRSVILNWEEGTGATGSERYASAIFDDRYWLSCSSNNAKNNIIYVADSNIAFTKFSNIPANILFDFNNKKYFASSNDNNIFEFNEINTDSGTATSSLWKSAHTYLENPDVYKWLRYAFFTGRKQTGDFIYFDYSIDDSTTTTSQYVSFTDHKNVPKEFGQDIIGKNFYFTIRSTGTFELQGFSIYKEEKELNPLIP